MSRHLALLALAFATPLLAQNFGEITGVVTDGSGAVMPGVVVTIVSTATNQVRTATTNESGVYAVPSLVPGLYDIRAENTGFKTGIRKDIDLEVGAVARINFTMEVGDVSQQVEVVAGAPLLTTESTALGTVIENRRIIELPLNGRNALQLIALSPNVTVEGGAGGSGGLQGGARSQASFSIAGQRLEYNRYTLDGIENTDPNFNSYIINPSVDALQEFKVQTGVYSAEFGRATSQISATTKSGSNAYHGTAFEFLRNSVLDAREWKQSEGEKNPFRRNQYGFTFGGPVLRNRVFFLANFEQTRDRKTVQRVASVATDRMRAGDFSTSGRTIYDPATRVFETNAQGQVRAVSASPFPGNVIPRQRFNPVSQKLFEFYPAPTVGGDVLNRNFVFNAPRKQDADQFNLRMDWNQNSRSNWFARYSWGDELAEDTPPFPTEGTRTLTTVRQAMLSNTLLLGASTVHDARFGWNNFANDRVGKYAYERDIQSELGIVGLTAAHPAFFGIPAISLGNGLASFGGGDPWVARNHTFQFVDSVSMVRGKHSIKFGGEVRRDRYNNFGNQKAPGEFIFTGQATFDPTNRNATGHTFADFLLGETNQSARALASANAMLRGTAYYLFVQDDWKITPRLTLNVGLRYENNRPWYDKYRGIMNVQMFDPGVGPDGLLPGTRVPILTRPGSGDFYQDLNFRFHDGIPVQAGDQYIGRSLVHPDNNDLAPRIGVSYSPSDRWTFRTGYGLFYTKDAGNPVFDMARNMAGRGFIAADIERPNANLSDPWKEQREQFVCTGWSGACLGPFQVLGNIVGRRTPYVHQWLFNLQRQLTNEMMLEVGYQGNSGHKLERFRTYNQAVLKTGPNDARTIAQRRPWTAYDRIQQVDGSVNSNYHALSTKLQQRFSRGLTYLASFTWSKAIDGGSALRTNSGDRLWPTNSYDLAAERGLSQFHIGRRFVGSAIYELPFGPGKALATGGILGAIIGGWQVGGIVTLADGAPTNVGSIGDTFAVGGLGNIPHATGISPIPQDRSADNFWNPAAFDSTNPNLSYLAGNAGRNVLFKPGTSQIDASLTRNIRIRESHSLQFRWESFNATNHPNWNPPSTDARNAATFGKVTTARTMREMQFALKYIF
ncbi:MAG TPA: TonB-dependent receptor [Bryobacteraceae bacterium]|nr:TonB-dependent receptor [Bryobacteraceae bacterium]